MQYRNLGKHGIKVSELSFGSWVTFGNELNIHGVKNCIRTAFDAGINFFDNAEAYASGVSEMLMGEALKDYRREDLVISTKIFWGGQGPNDQGLSWKHLVEGTRRSLKRLQIDYVDLLFCHRPDPSTPIEETVRAMDFLIRSGCAFYWGTSEWSREQIEEAHAIAIELKAIPPAMEQPEYNLFNRKRVEGEYLSLFERYGMGATTWSPLESGILTGKYNAGIPENSRFARHPELKGRLTPDKIKKVQALQQLAERLGCKVSALAIAWCLKNPNVSSVITGASSQEQLKENLRAIELIPQMGKEIMDEIERIL